MQTLNRRNILQASAAAVATYYVSKLQAEDKSAAKIPIVDTHQHLWDLKKYKLPWLKDSPPKLAKSFMPEDYAKATEGLNVVKSVYMEVDVEPEQQQDEADYVIGLCKEGKTPMVAAVISGRPGQEGFKKYIDQFKGSKYIKGIREVVHNPRTPKGYILEKSFIKSIQLLGELGLSYDICIRPGELSDAAKLVDDCPGTRFILDHCGNADVQWPKTGERDQWKKDMAAIANRKNIVCKVSGIVASAKPGAWSAADLAPFVNHTVEVFGKERVMFGGDWPVCTLGATYKEWVEALKSIVSDWKEADQKKLFHDNAVKFYGLS